MSMGSWGGPEYGMGGGNQKDYSIEIFCILVFIIMVILAISASGQTTTLSGTANAFVTMRVLSVSKDRVTAQPYISPVFDLKMEEGFAPKEKDVLVCEWQDRKAAYGDHTDNAIAFVCQVANEGTGALKKTLTLRGMGF